MILCTATLLLFLSIGTPQQSCIAEGHRRPRSPEGETTQEMSNSLFSNRWTTLRLAMVLRDEPKKHRFELVCLLSQGMQLHSIKFILAGLCFGVSNYCVILGNSNRKYFHSNTHTNMQRHFRHASGMSYTRY